MFRVGNCLVLRRIVELLRIYFHRRVIVFPDDRSAQRFILINRLVVVQFHSNSCRTNHNMLRGIARLQQVFWRSFSGQGDDSSRPLCLRGESRLPFQL